jgi:hypothetical protein
VLFHSPHRGSFHLSLTVLVHYRSTKVFSLGGWAPQLPTELACSVVLRILTSLSQFQIRDSHPLWSAFPVPFFYLDRSFCQSYNPTTTKVALVWAAPLSLATTHGIVSFPPGTEMFQFPGFPARRLCVHRRLCWHSPAGVSPFGYLRINASPQLPVAFRSGARPSSAFVAKASTVCP